MKHLCVGCTTLVCPYIDDWLCVVAVRITAIWYIVQLEVIYLNMLGLRDVQITEMF